MKFKLENLELSEEGLIPVIIQDEKTLEVLMMAYMNLDSLKATLKDGKTSFWSRSRKKFWLKGETSGHFQHVKSVYYDCDKDTLLIKVEQIGGACHDGYRSCFYTQLVGDETSVVGEKVFDPEQKYQK
ncbi:MAG: phosphoribosyl-AMP cyclohydrolase [Chlamydiae bacterium]|nr:phosphoribosyl-AMP cyclohydrolase [Chlamydiota bacterium]MBI3277527.1 phosphoribosyl-AMP cyclohydrolase [Chlamydiota bacterium]